MINVKRFLPILVLMLSVPISAFGSGISYDDLRSLKDSSESARELRGSDLLQGIDLDAINSSAGKFKQDAMAALETVTEQHTMQETQALEKYGDVETIYFVSMSLGESSLKRIFEEAGQDRVKNIVVIQGIKEGAKIPDGLQPYFKIVREVDNPPAFVLDPSLFEAYGITKVPAIVEVDTKMPILEQSGLARVYGLESSNYLDDQIMKGNVGDLGVRGNVTEIEEPNLIEVMKERLAQVDWEEKKQQAVNRFWDNQEFYEIPSATEDRIRRMNPSIHVTEDITAPNGDIVVHKGTTINPLEKLPFNRTIYVFNPTKQDEVDFVKNKVKAHDVLDGKVVLVASQLHKEDGWEKYESLTHSFNRPVFKLMPDLKARWAIERTPTIITAEDDEFVISEIAVNMGEVQ